MLNLRASDTDLARLEKIRRRLQERLHVNPTGADAMRAALAVAAADAPVCPVCGRELVRLKSGRGWRCPVCDPED